MRTMRRATTVRWVMTIGLGMMLCGAGRAEAHGRQGGVSFGFGFPLPIPIPLPVFRYDPGPRHAPAPSCHSRGRYADRYDGARYGYDDDDYARRPSIWVPGHWERRRDAWGRPLQVWIPAHRE